MNEDNCPERTCFCVFQHNAFQRGNEGGEDGSQILKQLLYRYPNTISERSMEHLLSVIISLYTFSTLSLDNKKIDFLSWSKSKIAIQTCSLNNGNELFILLRAPSVYSDYSVKRALDHIRKGLFFVLGKDGLADADTIQRYLDEQGERICKDLLPSDSFDPLPFSFTNLPNAEWHRGGVTTALTELFLMQQNSNVWGIVCFVNNLLVVSHSPLDLIRLFDFIAPESTHAKVYLTAEDRANLVNYPGCIANLPDLPVIEAKLLRFQYEAVMFYLLIHPESDASMVDSIQSIISKAVPDISAVNSDDSFQMPPSSIMYDRELNLLRSGSTTNEFQANAIYAHDSFVKNPNLMDVVLHNAKECTVCMNIYTIEHYSSVTGNLKASTEALYEDALHVDPMLLNLMKDITNQNGS